jgi:pentatricopeptide repeat protein
MNSNNKNISDIVENLYKNSEGYDDLALTCEKTKAISNLIKEIEDIEFSKSDSAKEANEDGENILKSLENDENKLVALKIKSLVNMLRSSFEFSNKIWTKCLILCLKHKKYLELVQVLIEKERNESIFEFFAWLDPTESNEYEDCLFLFSDYFIKNSEKVALVFKLLDFAVTNNKFSLLPLFSLVLKKLSKFTKNPIGSTLLNYLLHYSVEISTCAINYHLEILCRQDKIDEARTLFNKLITYRPFFIFPEASIKKCKFTKLITTNGISIFTYGTFIKALCKANNLDLAFFYYQELKKTNLIEDEVIFNLLIDGCSKAGNIEKLKLIYCDMLGFNITPTIVTFNTIIDAYIRSKDVDSAWKIYNDLVSKGIKPDNFTYSTLFRGLKNKSHRQYLLESFKILEDLQKQNAYIDVILVNVLLDSCISMKEDRLIVELFDKVLTGSYPNLKADIITYNTFIKGCAQMNLYDKAFHAYESLFSRGTVEDASFHKDIVVPNDVFFNTMIDVCVRSNNMSRVWDIIDKMKNNGIKPDNFTYSTIIKGLNKNSNMSQNSEVSLDSTSELELALTLFENVKKFSKPDEILYNCIMDACLRFDKIDKMLELYDEMLNKKIKPSSITCGIIIKAYGMKGYLGRALEVYENMKKENIPISSITYGCLINACITNENLSKAFELYEEIAHFKIEMNIVLYTTMIKAYSKKKDLTKVLEIFYQMKNDKHNAPNNVTYNSVIDCCAKCEDISTAEKIFREMNSRGVRPDIITFSTLIKGFLKKGELDTALEFLYEMKAFNVKPDEVLLNSFLDGCEKLNAFSKAVEIFALMRNLGVEPSMMSFSIMMKVYGKLNDFTNSKALLEEVKRKNKNINLIIFTCYMKTCFNTGNIDEGLFTYKSLKNFKLKADNVTFSTVLTGLNQKSKNKNDEIVSILKDSLDNNVNLYDRVYSEIYNKLSVSDPELALHVQDLLDSHNITLKSGKIVSSGKIKKSENNISFLINNYKHKKSHDKEKFSNENEGRITLKPKLMERKALENVSTGTNYSNKLGSNDIKKQNINFHQDKTSEKFPDSKKASIVLDEENLKRPVFINSKKQDSILSNGNVIFQASKNLPVFNNGWKRDGKPKKVNRF